MPAPDPLYSVLKVRGHQRDLLQQSVSQARAQVKTQQCAHDLLAQDREAVLRELRALNEAEIWDVPLVIQRRLHAEDLAVHLKSAEARVAEAEVRLKAELSQLLDADQAFQAVERLIERRAGDQRQAEERSTAREYDDMTRWNRQASH